MVLVALDVEQYYERPQLRSTYYYLFYITTTSDDLYFSLPRLSQISEQQARFKAWHTSHGNVNLWRWELCDDDTQFMI